MAGSHCSSSSSSSLPGGRHVDVLIVGNGPSALILSYILHGHFPYYDGVHHDALLHSKLQRCPDLLSSCALSSDLTAHFASSLRYSTQALPINTLLDTLLRPNADVDLRPVPHVRWTHDPAAAISHLVLGDAPAAGGQWTQTQPGSGGAIGTLSYAEMLSLPAYTFAEHYARTHGGAHMPDFTRPTRDEVAAYYAAYPAAVGIADTLRCGTTVSGVRRLPHGAGFYVASHELTAKYLVLASGIFTHAIPPPPLLSPLLTLPSAPALPLLVIGSGFSAADVLLSAPATQPLLHLFRWNPARPSPLKGCHKQAYPEYAGVYRAMKAAAAAQGPSSPANGMEDRARLAGLQRTKLHVVFHGRDWSASYEGLANAEVVGVQLETREDGRKAARIRIKLAGGSNPVVVERVVGGLAYAVGRRGSLAYLDADLRREVLGSEEAEEVHAGSLRERVERSFEVAEGVFAIGSLAGDSLVRHAFGGAVWTAGRIVRAVRGEGERRDCGRGEEGRDGRELEAGGIRDADADGVAGESGPEHHILPESLTEDAVKDDRPREEGPVEGSDNINRGHRSDHVDLHLDRRELSVRTEGEPAEVKASPLPNEAQAHSKRGWWAGRNEASGCVVS